MALKILTKKEDPPKLPEGGDRFVWTALPESLTKKSLDYASVLKHGHKDAKTPA